MAVISYRTKCELFAVVAYVLQNTQNLAISSCCFAEDSKETYKDLSMHLPSYCFAH